MRLAVAAAALLSPLHCGPLPIEQRVVPAGRYAYEVAVRLPDAADSTYFRGTLVVERSTPDSLTAHLEVPELERSLVDGRFDMVSYRMVANRPGDTLNLVHYIRPLGEGRTPRCTVGATRPGYFVDGRCTLRSVAP